METRIVSSDNEASAAIAEFRERGMHLAAVSNAGLPKGQFRLTFLPASAFVKGSKENP